MAVYAKYCSAERMSAGNLILSDSAPKNKLISKYYGVWPLSKASYAWRNVSSERSLIPPEGLRSSCPLVGQIFFRPHWLNLLALLFVKFSRPLIRQIFLYSYLLNILTLLFIKSSRPLIS